MKQLFLFFILTCFSSLLCAQTNVALNKPVTSSSVLEVGSAPQNAVDGLVTTRWASRPLDNQWLQVDLGQPYAIQQVVIQWGKGFSTQFHVEVSSNSITWQRVHSDLKGTGGTDTISLNQTTRYVRTYISKRTNDAWGVAILEMSVLASPVATSSSSSSIVASSSSRSSSSVGGIPTYNDVVISWIAPDRRENGADLALSEIGGYEIRAFDTSNKFIYGTIIYSATANRHTVASVEQLGVSSFKIATFDTNGLYSKFVVVVPSPSTLTGSPPAISF
jgi:hypothetical protein